MPDKTIFETLHLMDNVTNHLIIKWNQSFQQELGISHILVLSHLMSSGKTRPSEMANKIGLTPPTLTHLSNKLVKKGLIERIADEADRRIIYLLITEAGKQMVEKANIEGQELRRTLFERLTKEELQQLLHIYQKLDPKNM